MGALNVFLCFLSLAVAGQATPVGWSEINRQPPKWYAGADARAIAGHVLAYQTSVGGWPKNTDMTRPPSAEFLADRREDHRSATIDNGATTTQIRFLARVVGATGDASLRRACLRGLDYLLAAQYANGGWPQFYPLRKGYHTHITFNDDAMVRTLEVLDDVAHGREPYDWTDSARRTQANDAVRRGIECILRCQIVTAGVKTAWCAQHDEVTFAPAPARTFEPVSLTADESVGILRFLLRAPNPSPEVIASVQAGVAWLNTVKITGFRAGIVAAPDQPRGKDLVITPDPDAGPIWARFYEIGTNRPIFIGRDAIIRYSLAEIEHERRVGYAWYNESARTLLERDHPRWAARSKR